MHHSCSHYGVASCFPSRGSSGSRGIQRVLPQCDIGEPIFPHLFVLSLCMSKGHTQMADESGRPVTPSYRQARGRKQLWLSSPAQYHREACTGLCEWHGQTFAPRRPPADLCVWLVREGNGRGTGEGNHRGGAVRGGSVPGVDRVGE